MAKFEVLIVYETNSYYYVEADSEDDAIEIGVEMHGNGEPDQNPGCGWAKWTSATAESMPTEKEETNA